MEWNQSSTKPPVAYRIDLKEKVAAAWADRLTPREAEVATLLAAGLSVEETGRYLDISDDTVGSHRTRAAKKLSATGLGGDPKPLSVIGRAHGLIWGATTDGPPPTGETVNAKEKTKNLRGQINVLEYCVGILEEDAPDWQQRYGGFRERAKKQIEMLNEDLDSLQRELDQRT